MNDGSLSNDHVELVLRLKDLKKNSRSSLVHALDADAIAALADVALNVVIGTIPTDEASLRALRRRREELLELTKVRTSTRRREELLADPTLLEGVLNVTAPVIGQWRLRPSNSRIGTL